MIFKGRIEKQASEQAANFFVQHEVEQTILKTSEDIENLALREAEKFYLEGKVLFFLKTSKLGTKGEVIETYKAMFIDGYKFHKRNIRQRKTEV